MTTEYEYGSALITNTTLYQASAFIANPKHSDRNCLEPFFDLSTLVEAVILHPRLYRIEGEVSDGLFDYESSPLISTLRSAGVLPQEKITVDAHEAQRNLIKVVGTERAFNRIMLPPHQISFWISEAVPSVFPDERQSWYVDRNSPRINRSAFNDAIAHPAVKDSLNSAHDVYHFFRGDSFLEFLRGTGSSERGAYILRTYL